MTYYPIMKLNPDELNPDHPTTRGVHDHWHKIVALLMMKFNLEEVTITREELTAALTKLEGQGVAIKFDDEEGILLKMVKNSEMMGLAVKEGGLKDGVHRRRY